MVGTPIQIVGRKRSKVSWIAALPKAGISTQHARATRQVITPQVMPHTAALKGPTAREVPDSGSESWNIWQWEWQS